MGRELVTVVAIEGGKGEDRLLGGAHRVGVGGGRGSGDGRAARTRTIPSRGAPRAIPAHLRGLAPRRAVAELRIPATVPYSS